AGGRGRIFGSIAQVNHRGARLRSRQDFRRRRFEGGKHCVASECLPEFFGNGEGIITNAIDSSGGFGNDLEERAQTEAVCAARVRFPEFCWASAIVYSRIVSAAISSQRNCSAVCRHLADSAL